MSVVLSIETTFVCWQYCHVGRLSHEVGWKYRDVVRKLEDKRKVKSIKQVAFEKKLKVCIITLKLYDRLM